MNRWNAWLPYIPPEAPDTVGGFFTCFDNETNLIAIATRLAACTSVNCRNGSLKIAGLSLAYL